MAFRIRSPKNDDAQMAVQLLRRSISELCHEDHQNDPAEISSWLENKTVETWSAWVEHPDATVFVAEESGTVRGVGMVRSDGEILLNYVSPDARFQGVSKAILLALENEALAWGARSTLLESTRTAQRFYLANDYAPENVLRPLRMAKFLPVRS